MYEDSKLSAPGVSVKPLSEIQRGIERILMMVERVDKLTNSIEDTLSPILRLRDPSNTEKDLLNLSTNTQLGEFMQQHGNKLEVIGDTLNSILERLEI